MSPVAVSAPQSQSFQEEGIGIQEVIDHGYFKGKTYLVYSTELLIWEMAVKYGLDYDFHKKVIDCECSIQKNHSSCLGDSGMAFGRVQFWESTFNQYCQGDYYSEEDQLDCYGKMMSENRQNHWTCYTRLIR